MGTKVFVDGSIQNQIKQKFEKYNGRVQVAVALVDKDNGAIVPDLLITDNLTKKRFAIELKNGAKRQYLSMAALPLTRALKKRYRDAVVVVATNTQVPSIVKAGFDESNVRVVAYGNSEEAVVRVVDYVEKEMGIVK